MSKKEVYKEEYGCDCGCHEAEEWEDEEGWDLCDCECSCCDEEVANELRITEHEENCECGCHAEAWDEDNCDCWKNEVDIESDDETGEEF